MNRYYFSLQYFTSLFFMTVVVLGVGLSPHSTPSVYATSDQSRDNRVSPASYCAAEKIDASGEYMAAVLECAAQARSKGQAVGRECQQQALRKLEKRFAAAERARECKTVGDSATVANRIDTSVAELAATLQEPNPSQCAKHKLSAMGKDGERQHECYADAVAKGAGFSVDLSCQDKATQQFLAEFDRSGARRDCVAGTADGPTLDTNIRAAVRGSRATVAPPVSTCAPIEVTTFHGDSFAGNARLSKIENGQVPCLHSEDGTIATCTFSTAPEFPSGEWLESPQGNFALVGQALSLTGRPGGEYIVAGRVSDAAPAPCVEPSHMDTAGRVGLGNEIAQSCMVEDMNAEYNALSAVKGFTPIVNYADREVCMANRPGYHPDNAELVRFYASSGSGPPDTFCYSGHGAALNDVNGAERDSLGGYFPGEEYCHFIVVSGYEIPGAKRPATRSFPAPGGINTKSIILWRPVSPNFNIANAEVPGPSTPPQIFTSKEDFLNVTNGHSATGALPDLGVIGESVTIGEVTLSLAPGGNTLAVGTVGTGAEPDWMPLLPGNDIALGYENLQVQVALTTRVYALGFDFFEPNLTMPAYGGIPVDSTFEVVLYRGATQVGRFTFNAPDDEVAFIGMWSAQPFDRVTIIDTTGDHDDEFFGQFYTSANQFR